MFLKLLYIQEILEIKKREREKRKIRYASLFSLFSILRFPAKKKTVSRPYDSVKGFFMIFGILLKRKKKEMGNRFSDVSCGSSTAGQSRAGKIGNRIVTFGASYSLTNQPYRSR